MRVTINQPAFLPWRGFFARIMAADRFILLDNVAPCLGSDHKFLVRNWIPTPNGQTWFTLPVDKKTVHGSIRELDVREPEASRMLDKMRSTLRQTYGKAPYWKAYADFHNDYVLGGDEFMRDMNNMGYDKFGGVVLMCMGTILSVMRWIGEPVGKIVPASLFYEYGQHKGTDLLIHLCRAVGGREYVSGVGGLEYVEVEKFKDAKLSLGLFQKIPEPPTPVVRSEFRDASILDLIAHCPREALREQIMQEWKVVPFEGGLS